MIYGGLFYHQRGYIFFLLLFAFEHSQNPFQSLTTIKLIFAYNSSKCGYRSLCSTVRTLLNGKVYLTCRSCCKSSSSDSSLTSILAFRIWHCRLNLYFVRFLRIQQCISFKSFFFSFFGQITTNFHVRISHFPLQRGQRHKTAAILFCLPEYDVIIFNCHWFVSNTTF